MPVSEKTLDRYWDAIIDGDDESAQQIRSEFTDNKALQELAQLLEQLGTARIELGESWRVTRWEPGKSIGNYEILDWVGEGGMGVVYRAKQLKLNRIVAIKTIRNVEYVSPSMIRRFKDEASTIAKLKHPNIVAVHEVGNADNSLFFSMDFIDGNCLAQQLKGQPLEWREAARLISLVADAISHAHQHQVLHRDVKPSNILIDASGTPYVSDFGLAIHFAINNEASANRLTRSGSIIGTPNYLSPEQASGQTQSHCFATDVYGLGATLYEMICARPPFVDNTLLGTLSQIMYSAPAAPRALNPNVPKDLNTICLKCLEKKTGDRYRTALEFKTDIDRLLDGEPIQAKPPSWIKKTTLWCQKKKALSATLFLLGLTLVFGSVFSTAMWMRSEAKSIELNESRNEVITANKDLREVLDAFFLKFIYSDTEYARLPARTRFELCRQLMAYYDKVLNRTPGLQRADTVEICTTAINYADRQIEYGDHMAEVHTLCCWVLAKVEREDENYNTRELGILAQAATFAYSTSVFAGKNSGDKQELLNTAIRFAREYDSAISDAESFRILADARRCKILHEIDVDQIGTSEAISRLEQLETETSQQLERFPNDPRLFVFQGRLLRNLGVQKGAKSEIQYRGKAIGSFEKALEIASNSQPDMQVSVARLIPLQRIYQGIQYAELGTFDQAFECLTTGTTELEELVASNPAYLKIRMDLAESYARTADLKWFRGRYKEALELIEKARAEMQKTILIDSGQNTAMRRLFQLGWTYSRRLKANGRAIQAAQFLDTAIENGRMLLSDELFHTKQDKLVFLAALKEAEQLNLSLNNKEAARKFAAEHEALSQQGK